MYRRYYDGYDYETQGAVAAPYEIKDVCDEPEQEVAEVACADIKTSFGGLAIDDILLIGVLILLLHEGCDDTPMLLIIGFLLLAGFLS